MILNNLGEELAPEEVEELIAEARAAKAASKSNDSTNNNALISGNDPYGINAAAAAAIENVSAPPSVPILFVLTLMPPLPNGPQCPLPASPPVQVTPPVLPFLPTLPNGFPLQVNVSRLQRVPLLTLRMPGVPFQRAPLLTLHMTDVPLQRVPLLTLRMPGVPFLPNVVATVLRRIICWKVTTITWGTMFMGSIAIQATLVLDGKAIPRISTCPRAILLQ